MHRSARQDDCMHVLLAVNSGGGVFSWRSGQTSRGSQALPRNRTDIHPQHTHTTITVGVVYCLAARSGLFILEIIFQRVF